jgi:hypothetical protein
MQQRRSIRRACGGVILLLGVAFLVLLGAAAHKANTYLEDGVAVCCEVVAQDAGVDGGYQLRVQEPAPAPAAREEPSRDRHPSEAAVVGDPPAPLGGADDRLLEAERPLGDQPDRSRRDLGTTELAEAAELKVSGSLQAEGDRARPEFTVASRRPVEAGETVDVLYLEEEPEAAVVGSKDMSLPELMAVQLGLLNLILLPVGGLLCLIGGVALVLPGRGRATAGVVVIPPPPTT